MYWLSIERNRIVRKKWIYPICEKERGKIIQDFDLPGPNKQYANLIGESIYIICAILCIGFDSPNAAHELLDYINHSWWRSDVFPSVQFYYDRKWPGVFQFQWNSSDTRLRYDFVIERKKKNRSTRHRSKLIKILFVCKFEKVSLLARTLARQWIIVTDFLQLYIVMPGNCFFYLFLILFIFFNLRSVRQNVE